MPGRGKGGRTYGSGSRNPRDRDDRIESGYNDVADMFDTMFTDLRSDQEKEMQEARAISFLGGIPFIGDFVRGVEQAKQVEDLYNRTGKVSAYPALTGGYGGLGSAIGGAALNAVKIATGVNDLYQFYSGEPDAFRSFENNSYM